jgi:hypothetical protein
MIADADRESITATALQFLEIERGITVIMLPEIVALSGQLLRVKRQGAVQLPEAARAF